MSHQMFAYGDTETTAVSNAFPLVTETQQSSPARAKSSPSARPDSGSSSPSVSSTRSSSPGSLSPSEVAVPSYASSLPHLRPMSPIEMPSLQHRASDSQQSFIDFFSSSSPPYPQHDLSTSSARRPSAPAILPSSINFTSSSNSPLDDLPSMVFAPPSPTSASNDRPTSPADSRPSSSLSTYSDVSAMIFAPGSPTSGPRTFPRPSSSRSPIPSYSPPEPAPPSPACSDAAATLKPPVPTTTKPLFEKRGRKVRLQKRSVSSSPQPPLTRHKVPLPPTTNTLHADERADLIRRNRKLVQLLGQTPGAEKASEVEEPRLFRMLPQPAFSALLGSAKQKHNHRHAMSVSVAVKTPNLKGEPSSPWNVLDCPPSPSGRRHSIPYTPRGFTFYLDDSLESRNHDHHGPHHQWNLSGCPTSFIDLSDEELPHDPSEVISIQTPSTANGRRNHSSSTSSLVESLTPEEQAEAERRRKRDKLAKLHRFLGSRVPTDLVVGNIAGPSLPPASMPEDPRDMWLYRRMSSASALSFERVKEELGDEEKALNVKRAQKMEKVLVSFVVRCLKRLSFQQLFGMPPPQTLYHTRHAPATVARSQPTSPVSSVMAPHYFSVDDPGLPRRNPNQSAYTKGKKTHRPGTSESTTYLLPFKSPKSPSSPESSQSGFLDVLTRSSVYMHYQHSIASLTDIIDRVSNRKHESLPRYSQLLQDDRESLAELHRFLHGDVVESPTDDQPLLASHRLSTSTYSHKSDRRRSLPTRTSIVSISNDMIPPNRPEASDFQIRRRRAAKLTSFFGVDYRELIHDILESIEKGVEEERKRGTLRPEEVDVSFIVVSVWNHLLTVVALPPTPSLCCINFTTFG